MKPHVNAQQAAILYKAMGMMNSATRGYPFATYTGVDPLADTKHDKAWTDYGWPQSITNFMLWNMWRRSGVAHNVVKMPVDICWMTKPCIVEGEDDAHDETAFEKEFSALAKRLKLWTSVRGADLRNRVMRYSALLFTVADGKTPDKPLDRVSVDKVVRVQPLYESQLEVATVDTDRKSARYGMPETYQFNESDIGNRDEHNAESFTVHWTRVVIFAEGADDGSIYGISCLESVFNSLIDWQKVKGSGGEGFWRAAAQRFVMEASKDTAGQAPKTEELDALSDMVMDMFAGFDKIPYTGNWSLKPLSTDMPNPESAGQLIKEDIAAGSGMPLKIIFGTQTGVKAGDEDTSHFMRQMQSRRENTLTDFIESIIDWFGERTTLKIPEYTVVWDDLTAPSALQKAELGIKMADANQKARLAGNEPPFSTNEIREAFGYDADEDLDEENLPDDFTEENEQELESEADQTR